MYLAPSFAVRAVAGLQLALSKVGAQQGAVGERHLAMNLEGISRVKSLEIARKRQKTREYLKVFKTFQSAQHLISQISPS